MKRLLSLISISAIVIGLPVPGFAAEKKMPKATPTEAVKKAAEKPAEAAKEAPAKIAGEGKAIPMYVRADAVDAPAKTFTMKKKDGAEVKHVFTDTTTIMNGEAPAKLADIKVGDYVSGSRRKKSDTEYEVLKVTKFGAAAPRKAKAEAEKNPEEKKAN